MFHFGGSGNIAGMNRLVALLVLLGLSASAAEIKLTGPAKLNHATTNSLPGGLVITFNPPATYPFVSWTAAQPWDWSGTGGLLLDVTNPSPAAISFSIRIDDDPSTDGKLHCRTASGRVLAHQAVTFLMPFNADPLAADLGELPGVTLMRDTGPGGFVPFNLNHIVAWEIFLYKPKIDATLGFSNARFVPAPATLPLKTDTKVLRTCKTVGDLTDIVTNMASVALAPDGRLRLQYETGAYPAVQFKVAPPADYRGYGGLAFDLTNPGTEIVRFGVRIDDDPSADGTGNHSRSGGATIDAGQTVSFVMPFGIEPMALGMKSLPGFNAMRSLGSIGTGPFTLGHVSAYQIFLVRPATPKELLVTNLRLVPGVKPDYTGIMDEFGQYTRAEWPGKLLSPAEFARQRATEAIDLAAHPALPGRDKFGGWAAGPQLPATGFFRTEKVGGKWALVDPDGHLFFSVGLDSVGPAQWTGLSGRESMFAVAPTNDPVLAKHLQHDKTDTVDYYGANLERKYGENYRAVWLATTLARLPAWGFNTIGAFASYVIYTNGAVPYTATVWPANNHARVAGGGGDWRLMDDPFDSKFATDVALAIKGMPAAVKSDPYCLGYFVGNEESWGSQMGPRAQFGLVLGALKATLAESPAKRAFVAQLKEKYGDTGKLNAAWGTQFANWDAVAGPVMAKEPFTAAMQADLSALLKSFALRYFRTVRDELKKADPNHLYLGCRFAGWTTESVQAAAEAADVLSFNIYRLGINPKEWTVLDGIDRPVIVGEFHFGATDRGLFDPGLVAVTDQAARAKAYQAYVRSVLDHPQFVGCHWFQYADEPLLGRAQDGENGNLGFITITDAPYPEMIAAARAVHAEIYPRRFGK